MRNRCRKNNQGLTRRLGRPCLRRHISSRINFHYFKPRGIPITDLEIIELTAEEAEAMRLKNIMGFDQIECAKQMKTSQSTFQRILSSAYKKISEAIVEGKAIKIIKS